MYVDIDQIVELMMIVAHRSRMAFDESCAVEEFVPHEVLLLRACAALKMKGRELARALGWSPGRVSQVAEALVQKEMLHRDARTKALTRTGPGSYEAQSGGYLLKEVGETLLEGMSYEERAAFQKTLERIAKNSEKLWRPTRDAIDTR